MTCLQNEESRKSLHWDNLKDIHNLKKIEHCGKKSPHSLIKEKKQCENDLMSISLTSVRLIISVSRLLLKSKTSEVSVIK